MDTPGRPGQPFGRMPCGLACTGVIVRSLSAVAIIMNTGSPVKTFVDACAIFFLRGHVPARAPGGSAGSGSGQNYRISANFGIIDYHVWCACSNITGCARSAGHAAFAAPIRTIVCENHIGLPPGRRLTLHSRFFRNLRKLAANITTPQARSARRLGHSSSSPTPFRNMPRTITR